jgi:putative SOS response-associated peptidase YedK
MCGRFALTISPQALAKLFQLEEVPELEPRYNIAPSQAVAAVVQGREEARRILKMMQWGFIPFWAKDPGIGMKMINARAETAAEKPAFRDAFAHKRCLVPASGFYEWQKRGKAKQPYFIRLQNEECFAMAGLWQRWEGQDGRIIESCNILTTESNALMTPIHNRMPVILAPDHYELWLDCDPAEKERLQQLFRPLPAETMEAYPVSKSVNRPTHDAPDCVTPLSENPASGGLFD